LENSNETLVEFFRQNRPFAEAFKCLFENASDAIYILDKNGNFVVANRKAEELTGFRREDFVGKSFRKIVLLKSLPKAIGGFLDVVRGREVRLELELKSATKKTVLAEVTSTPLTIKGKIVGTLGIVRETTKRVMMENKLKEANRRLRTLFETAMEGITVVDAEENFTFVNKAFADMLGYREDELIGMNLRRFVDGQGFKEIRKHTGKRKKGEISRYELVMFDKSGKPHIFQVSASPLWNEDCSFAGSLGIVMDVTEREKVEKAIMESQQKFERLFRSNPDASVYVNVDDRFLDANPRFVELFGYTVEEAKGRSLDDLIVPKDKKKEARDLARKSMEGYVYYETERKRKDGSIIPVSMSAAPIYVDDQFVGCIVSYRDITERVQMQNKLAEYSQQLEVLVEKRTRQLKEAQEQLVESERLAAVGQVAAMVGHDLRNPLTSISGATYYLKMTLGPKIDEKIKEMLEIMENDIEHANKILEDLVEYSREIRLELTETTPRSIVKETLSLVQIPDYVQVVDSTQDGPTVKIDLEKMKRVFANLIKNAVDAMPNGGKLTITSKESDGNVEIAFADTGTGMTKEVLGKIWIPFFTTKAKGMGLGLPICKRIIEAHGGNVSVESTLGKGAIFTLTVPIKPKVEEGGEKIWMNVPESLLSTTTKA